MVRDSFTDVVLHSLKNYHQEHVTKPRRLLKDVAVMLRFHRVSNLCAGRRVKKNIERREPSAPTRNWDRRTGQQKLTSMCGLWYQRLDWKAGISNIWQQLSAKSRSTARPVPWIRIYHKSVAVDFECSRSEQPCGAVVLQVYVNLLWVICFVVWR